MVDPRGVCVELVEGGVGGGGTVGFFFFFFFFLKPTTQHTDDSTRHQGTARLRKYVR